MKPPHLPHLLRSLLALLLVLLVGMQLSHAAPIDVAALPDGALTLTGHWQVLEDPQQRLNVNQVRAARFAPSGQAGEALSYGYTGAAYWLKLELHNPGAQPVRRMLEISNARLGQVTLYQPGADHADGAYLAHHTGSTLPYATRAYPNRYFVFPLELPAGARATYYVRVASAGAKLIPSKLWTPAAYHRYSGQDYLLQGAYFGMVAAMLLFNLVLFATLGDRLYLQYVTFVACVGWSLAAQNGLAQEWLWPQASGAWPNLAASVGFSLSGAMLVVFMRRMMNTRTVIPRLDKILLGLLVFFLVTPVLFVGFYPHINKQVTVLWSIASPLIMLVCLACLPSRQRSAYYFTAAFGTLFIGNMTSSLAALAILPHNVLTNQGSQIGSACEMMLLAFALADRMHVMRREKAQAQRAALEAQSTLIASLQTSERELELRVAQRTEDLRQANQRLAALSVTDALTGIPNRRCFDEMLAREWAQAARMQRPLAVGLLDIDFFKQYNDHYGHQGGDDCLRRVAEEFAASMQRAGDVVARYGGEEFAFIAPGTSADNALALAERVCQAIAALNLPHANAPCGHVTVSLGVAAWVPKAGETPQGVLRAADEALYSAKRLGRNRAEVQEAQSFSPR